MILYRNLKYFHPNVIVRALEKKKIIQTVHVNDVSAATWEVGIDDT